MVGMNEGRSPISDGLAKIKASITKLGLTNSNITSTRGTEIHLLLSNVVMTQVIGFVESLTPFGLELILPR